MKSEKLGISLKYVVKVSKSPSPLKLYLLRYYLLKRYVLLIEGDRFKTDA